MTPRDQMSQDRSYFLDPNTSGAEKEKFKSSEEKFDSISIFERALTDIVGCVTRRFQSIMSMNFLRKPKVCQFQCPLLSCKGNILNKGNTLNSSFLKLLSPLLEKRRFSGLRSLWAMFLSCKNFTALHISFTISAASEKKWLIQNWTLPTLLNMWHDFPGLKDWRLIEVSHLG